MKRPSRKNPVITPTQKRSMNTFESILTATTYLLENKGWNSFTTNDIADKAGVNINSFYQYFLNREAAVLEVTRKLLTGDESLIAERIQKALLIADPRKRVSQFIDQMLSVFEDRPKLRRAILINVGAIVGRTEQVKRRLRIAEGFSALLPTDIYPTPASRALAARVVVHTFLGVNVAFLMEESDTTERNILKREIKLLCESYIFNKEHALIQSN